MKDQTGRKVNIENDHPSKLPVSSTKKGGQKILITYATKFGTTGEVAEAIAGVLCQEGHAVEAKWIKNVKALNEYDAVILGSPIQYGRWMPEATQFVQANQNRLSKLSVAYFFTCLTLVQKNTKTEKQALAYADKLVTLTPQVKLISVGRFAGTVNYRQMPFFLRLIFKSMLSVRGVQEGDYRDWDAIRAWAKEIHSKLADEPP